MADDAKYKRKYKDLRKRIRDIEEENDVLNVRLFKAHKSIRHLKLERTFLLDRMDKSNHTSLDYNSDNSDVGSDIFSHDESDMASHKIQGSQKQDGRSRIDKTAGSKPQRKKRDPNAPKGPGNVFFLYCRLERDKVKDEFPTENLGEVTRLLGQRWKSLPKDEKKKYYDMYNREVEEYEEAMKTYTSNGGAAVPGGLASAKAGSSTNLNESMDADLASIPSSPAQSTEMSMDFPSDPAQHHHDSPDVGSIMDDDDIKDADTATPQSDIYHSSAPITNWEPTM
ncbi:hypothetical protein V8B55DRAFT_1519544 [Mucor lusitanicus]|uniref:HMG box domain-containing protein n=2 Tax=Mucor circinelloides f. lusitanicus TaxID=29924 RepID=A0A168LBQ6_MUCCL|nr:hypothetical protein FB192DRAFT_1394930 [Mucor lusitanicus]OAD03337.1 hypothetical protein MUCCIDRAFT_110195 [Mucor lusitanicus CBS 277.49]